MAVHRPQGDGARDGDQLGFPRSWKNGAVAPDTHRRCTIMREAVHTVSGGAPDGARACFPPSLD